MNRQPSEKPAILLSFDIEEFDVPLEYGARIEQSRQMEISACGTRRILDILDSKKIRATFFITANFAQKHPELVERMDKSSHEIASHGFYHSGFEVGDLKKSRELLEKISGQKVVGFRMPRLAKTDAEELTAAGYEYDSSLNPTYLPGRYNNLHLPQTPYKEKCGLLRMPSSTVPYCRFPLFWLSFKNMPVWLFAALAKMCLKRQGCFNFYTHPWEYNSEALSSEWKLPGYLKRHAGESQTDRLGKLIDALAPHGEFMTLREYAQKVEFNICGKTVA